MNHFVPDFDTDDDYLNNVVNTNSSSSSSLNLPTKPITGRQDDMMELLWENGQVVLQNQRPNNNTSNKPRVDHHQQPLDQNLFIQEDEMTSWLHYPLRQDDLCSDLLFSSSPAAPPDLTQLTAARPPVPTTTRLEIEPRPPPVRNFMNFSRLRGNSTVSKAIVRESTQVNPSSAASDSGLIDSGGSAVEGKGKAVAIEIPGTSSSAASKEPVNVEPMIIVHDTKRRERDEETKQGRGSTSSTTKRSRAAQVHNLSERKRRDRINERMKALQELIPRCNKSDKASMLDEAIEYMKSLQLRIQMMSMGCGVMPMMYPGMQQYMAMGMGMGMNPPPSFMPFPNMLPPQRPLPMQTPMGVGSAVPHYPLHASDPTSSQPQFPGFTDPYQQFRNLHPTQPPQFQNQASSSRVSSGKESEDQGNHTTG